MRDHDDDAWFAPKRFGYGAGLPIRWPGWALLVVVIALVLAIQRWVPPAHAWLHGGLLLVLIVGAIVIAAQHTRGGWRWRWGDLD